MKYRITEDCVSCGACESVCPEDAISEGSDIYEIDPSLCTGCANCVEECPTEAIVPA